MMKNGDGRRRRRRFHVILGTPFEPDCPVCRAHGFGPEQVMIDGPEMLIVRAEPFEPVAGCECPLCEEAPPPPEAN